MSKKLVKNNVEISNNVDLIRENNREYFLYVLIPTKIKEKKSQPERFSGIDLGLRTFATVYSNSIGNETSRETKVFEYTHRIELLKKLNAKIDLLNSKERKKKKKRKKKRKLQKYEKRKKDLVDSLHWDFINDSLKENDVIFLGHIKSHNIVRGGKNKFVNRDFNDLKFYLLKQRFVYKSLVNNKKVILVKEHYTTKTCSNCGSLNNEIGSSKVFRCSCGLVADRDMNASKNILLKGLLN
jgi:IS605 OrfB family transposase